MIARLKQKLSASFVIFKTILRFVLRFEFNKIYYSIADYYSLIKSNLFNPNYYESQIKQNNLQASRSNLILHYLLHGEAFGLKANPVFNANFYRKQVERRGFKVTNALAHYYKTGAKIGLKPNALFDTDFYLARVLASGTDNLNPLAHYLRIGSKKHCSPSRFFDCKYYADKYLDGRSDIDALSHFIEYGPIYAYTPWSYEHVNLLLRPYVESLENSSVCAYLDRNQSQTTKTRTIGIFAHSKGNFFFLEIRDLLAKAFTQAGMQCMTLDEKSELPNRLDYSLVIAPHEFYYLSGNLATSNHLPGKLILFNTEQLQTPWFSRAFKYFTEADLIFDLCPQVAAVLAEMGFDAHFLPLNNTHISRAEKPNYDYKKSIIALPKEIFQRVDSKELAYANLPLDLFFCGTLSEKRAQFFSKHAAFFANYNNIIHLPALRAPLVIGESAVLNTDLVNLIAANSRIMLNIHRDEMSYFEWHRVVLIGLANQALVVTEPSFKVPGLVPGEHYIEASLEEMPNIIRWYLEDERGREEAERIRAEGFKTLNQHYDMQQIALAAVSLMEERC